MTPILAAVVWTYWFAPALFVVVVKMGRDERAVEHPVEMRPRRQADEQTASAA